MASSSTHPEVEVQQDKGKQPEQIAESREEEQLRQESEMQQQQQQQQQPEPQQEPRQSPRREEDRLRQQQQRESLAPQLLPASHQKVRFDRESQIIPPQNLGQFARREEDAELPYDHTWQLAKLGFSAFSIICSLVLLALGIYLSSTGYDLGQAEFGFTATLAGCALVWTSAEFLTNCLSRRSPQRGIHPGAHVGVHLIIWLYAVVVVVFLCIFETEHDFAYDFDLYDDGDVFVTYETTAYNVEKALIAFSVLMLLTHFILFVRACVETHQVNSMPRRTMVYVPVPMNANGTYGSPYGYYGQAPQPMGQLPPQFETAPGQLPFAPQQTLQGYYAPAGVPAMAPVPGQPNPAVVYGYYAPAPTQQLQPPLPARRSQRQSQPAAPRSTAGSSTVSPAPESTPHSPPTAPSPVSTA